MSAASEEDVYLLATALYGTDTRGRHLLISEPIPLVIKDIITADMQARIHPKAKVKIVPIAQYTSLALEDAEQNILLQKAYPNVLKVDLSKVESRRTLKTVRYYIVDESNRHRRKKDKAERGSLTETITEQTTNKTISPKKESDPGDYMPNDIYYAVEKKCANWADGCDTKSPSILEMSSTHFKVPLGYQMPPRKLRWTP